MDNKKFQNNKFGYLSSNLRISSVVRPSRGFGDRLTVNNKVTERKRKRKRHIRLKISFLLVNLFDFNFFYLIYW